MARRDADQTGKYIVLAAIAGAITLAVVGGAFWLMFRHPNESEQAKQAREQRQRDREYYDSLDPADIERAAKKDKDKARLEDLAFQSNYAKTKEAKDKVDEEYNRLFKEYKRNYPEK